MFNGEDVSSILLRLLVSCLGEGAWVGRRWISRWNSAQKGPLSLVGPICVPLAQFERIVCPGWHRAFRMPLKLGIGGVLNPLTS